MPRPYGTSEAKPVAPKKKAVKKSTGGRPKGTKENCGKNCPAPKKKKKKLVIKEEPKKKKKKLVIRDSTPQEKERDRKNYGKPNVDDIEDLEREGKNRLGDIQYDIGMDETDSAYYDGMDESTAMDTGHSRAFQYMNDFITGQMKGAKTNREVVHKINKLSRDEIMDLI